MLVHTAPKEVGIGQVGRTWTDSGTVLYCTYNTGQRDSRPCTESKLCKVVGDERSARGWGKEGDGISRCLHVFLDRKIGSEGVMQEVIVFYSSGGGLAGWMKGWKGVCDAVCCPLFLLTYTHFGPSDRLSKNECD